MGDVPVQEITLPARDGTPLAATLHGDRGAGGPVALVCAATGVHRGFYGRFATHLAERGVRALTFDYRGVGGSAPQGSLRGYDATKTDWATLDAGGALRWLQEGLAPTRLGFVGHSFGAQLVGLLPQARELDAVVSVAGQSGNWRLWPRPRRFLNAILFHVLVPGLAHLVGYLPTGKLGLWHSDVPKGAALEWARWCRHPDYLLGWVPEEARERYATMTAPLLAMSFADDNYAVPPAVDAYAGFFERAPVTRRHVEPAEVGADALGHFGFFQERGRPLWDEAAGWLRGDP